MEFGLLGVLEVIDSDGRRVDVGRPQRGALLALLLLHANQVLSVRAIVEGLWGDDPPESSVNLVQGLVSRLRKVLEGDVRLETVAPGYRLGVPLDAVDLSRFELLAAGVAEPVPAKQTVGLVWKEPAEDGSPIWAAIPTKAAETCAAIPWRAGTATKQDQRLGISGHLPPHRALGAVVFWYCWRAQ